MSGDRAPEEILAARGIGGHERGGERDQLMLRREEEQAEGRIAVGRLDGHGGGLAPDAVLRDLALLGAQEFRFGFQVGLREALFRHRSALLHDRDDARFHARRERRILGEIPEEDEDIEDGGSGHSHFRSPR